MDILFSNLPASVPKSTEHLNKEKLGVQKVQVFAAKLEGRVRAQTDVESTHTSSLVSLFRRVNKLRYEAARLPFEFRRKEQLVVLGGSEGFQYVPLHHFYHAVNLPKIDKSCYFDIQLAEVCEVLLALQSNRKFRSSKNGKIFFEYIQRPIRRLIQVLRKREAFVAERHHFVEALEISRARLPASMSHRRKDLAWPSLLNNVHLPLDDVRLGRILGIMRRTGCEREFLRQILPKGALTILEHWRMDLNCIAKSILELNKASPIGSAMPLRYATYRLHGRYTNDGVYEFQMFEKRVLEPQLERHSSVIFSIEDPTSVAGFITRKLDRQRKILTHIPSSPGDTIALTYREAVDLDRLHQMVQGSMNLWRELQSEL